MALLAAEELVEQELGYMGAVYTTVIDEMTESLNQSFN